MVTPKQWAILPFLLVAAVASYLAADIAETDPIVVWGDPGSDQVVVAGTPEETPAPSKAPAKVAAKASAAPAAKATPVKVAVTPSTAPEPANTPTPAAKPSAVAAKPSAIAAKPTAVAAKPSAVASKPTASASPPVAAKPVLVAEAQAATPASAPQMGGRHIAASTTAQLAALAKSASGRIDPFVSLEPPMGTAGTVPVLAPPRPPATPGMRPLSVPGVVKAAPIATPGDGMVVTGIITSPKESVAIIAAGGRSRLVQVGDVLAGGIRVMSIQPQGKSVIVSQGGRSARLAVKE